MTTAIPEEGSKAATPGRAPKGAARTRRNRLWMIGGLVVAVLALALAGSLVYTEESSFCQSCHEMGPYYRAWAAGPHGPHAQCVDCHVDAGVPAHLRHKPAALKEVWDHFFSANTFPNYTVDVPDSRCLGCHPSVPDKIGALFSHAAHAKKASCKECHAQTGHLVALASLAEAGVLKSGATTPTVRGMTPSVAPGHTKVVCQQCHDQAKMRCSACHQAPHEDRGECSNCHRTGDKFAAAHTTRADCTACHTAPAHHWGTDCATCHTPTIPFAKTVYAHTSGAACSTCHKAPSGHYGTACASCHTTDLPFAKTVYRHVSGSRCSTCHRAPSRHYGTSCASCHKPTVPFAKTVYRHASGSKCNACHRPPANHYTVTCSQCHSPSVAFAKTTFKHPSSTACASCHKAPANHFGTACSSCHKPSAPFASATFKHPSTGEHSYRAFACVKCHPSNYATAYCSCHNGHPPKD